MTLDIDKMARGVVFFEARTKDQDSHLHDNFVGDVLGCNRIS